MGTGQANRPSLGLFVTEPGRALMSWGALVASAPFVLSAPRGDGHGVLVLPGLFASDRSTTVLRAYLRGLGSSVHRWDMGRNIGPTAQVVAGLPQLAESLSERSGGPISVVGWSLGGIYARDLARARPSSVRAVVTLGSPFRMWDPRQSRAHQAYLRYAHLHTEPRTGPRVEHERAPMPVPTTSVYSHVDGIVSWEACVDGQAARQENVAVWSSHLGMGHDPAVLWVIADRLAQPPDAWRPFRPPPLVAPLYPAAAVAH